MLPLRATSGSSGMFGSVAVDENTTVWSSMNCTAVSSTVPKVICVFFFVSRSSRNSFWLPLTRAL